MILKEYNLSVRLPQERAIDTGITLVQNDKDVYKLIVRIFDGVNEIDYTDVDEATITFLKSDKNVVQGDMTVEADQLSYTLGTNEIACPGKVLVSIQLFGSTERLSTARFVIYVERDLVTEDAVKSASEFPILQQLKQDLEAIDVVELTNEFNAHKAEDALKHITESGSNANGKYIKFDDGTMICTQELTLDTVAYDYSSSDHIGTTWTYPASFKSPPSIHAIRKATTTSVSNKRPNECTDVMFKTISNTSANLRSYYLLGTDKFQDGDTMTVYATAIGRWK